MNKILSVLISAIFMMVTFTAPIHAQTSASDVSEVTVIPDADSAKTLVPTDEDILKMNIFDACKALGVNPIYNKRYDDIIMPLCIAGVVMFPASSNPYSDPATDGSTRAVITEYSGPEYADCFWYVGTGPQNGTLIRNMVANKHLIKNGKLVPGAAKRWKVVK